MNLLDLPCDILNTIRKMVVLERKKRFWFDEWKELITFVYKGKKYYSMRLVN